MSDLCTVSFPGLTGTQYVFRIYTLDTMFKPLGGVYAMLDRYPKPDGLGYLASPIYFGETSDLSSRFDNHHRQGCFDRSGVNCVAVHLDGDDRSRLSKEADLIARWNPECNQQ